jgi:hypothetical protein
LRKKHDQAESGIVVIPVISCFKYSLCFREYFFKSMAR